MNKIKKLISFLLVLVIMAGFSIPSYAATLSFSVVPSFENKTLRVSGTSDAGRMLTFYVTDQGISAADMTFDNNFYAMHQETVGNDGSFDVTMKLPQAMEEGVYKLIIGGLGADFDETQRCSEFDYMTSDGAAYILEAETASGLTYWTQKSDSLASGGGYVSMFRDDVAASDAKITFSFNVKDAMEYDIFAIVSGTAGHMSTHSFSVNGDAATNKTSFISKQLYSANMTSYEWPAHWAKIRSNEPLGKGAATIEYTPIEASISAGRLLTAIDAIYVVPSSWNWEPFELGTPISENRIRLNLDEEKTTLSSTVAERGGELKASVYVQTPALVDYNVPIWVEMRYKGELVTRKAGFAETPMNQWTLLNTSYKTVLTLDVPVVAPDGKYEIYCGVGSSAGFANVEGEKCIGTVTIGELDDPNPDTLAISSANAAQNGKILDVSYTLSDAADIGAAKAFVRFWDGDVLWGVAETEDAVDVETVGSAIAATLNMPSGMPSGIYEAELGFYNVNGTKTIGEMEIVSDKKNTYKPLSHGIYRSQKTGNHHFWYINQAGAAIWDGEPFIPIGGMYCPNILAGYSFIEPDTNNENWTEDMREIAILVENGVTDLYLNSSVTGSPTWVWEYVLNYLDERGIRYGIQPNGGGSYTEQDAFYIFSNAVKIASGSFSVATSGAREVTLTDKSIKQLGSGTPKYALYTLVNSSGAVVDAGKAEMTKGTTSGTYTFTATVTVPSVGDYNVYFTPMVNKSTNVVNFWKYGEQMIAHAEKFASKVAIGDGVRDIIDHATNESGYINQNANARPYDDAYNDLFKAWLKEKYTTIDKLHTAWENDNISDFAQASRIIPVYTSAEDSNDDYVIYGYDWESDVTFEFNGRTTHMWLDFIEFRDYAVAEFYNDLADAYKTRLDVPTVIKSVYFHQESFRNERLTGGLDGLGSESYAVAEGVGQKHMTAYALTQQFAKTGWSIVTETNVDEDVTGKYNRAYSEDEEGNITINTAELGYGTKERMHTNFDQLFDSGAKGIYDFVYSARHAPEVDAAYSYAYIKENHGIDQFAWENEYREKVNANIDTIANTPIEKNLVYFTPAAAYTNSVYADLSTPNRFSAAHITDHKWRNYSYKATGANSDYAVLLTDDPTVDAEYIAASFESGPVSTKQGVAFGNMLDTMDGDKVAIYLGFRYDIGTVPQLDKYFTDEFAYVIRNSKTVKVQVLDPGETGEVIYTTSVVYGNKPWAIRDGNLWIIAAEDWITTNGSGTLNYIGDIGIFMDEEDMVMQDFGFRDKDGAVIDTIEAGDNTLSVRIKNNTKDETDAVMYAAAYDNDGNLLSVSRKTRTLFSGLNYIETDLGLDGTEGSAKGFIWDKDMNPLTDVVLEIK